MPSAILTAENNTHTQWWKDNALRRLNFHLAVLQLGTIISGYDGSLMNGFFAIDAFLDDMGQPDANIQGLLIAAISLGTMIGLLFAGYWADKRGRKEPQQAGCLLIIIGAFFQTFSVSRWSFFGSRLIIGCGSGLLVITGSVHVIELAHPRQAPQHAALFGANWFVGAIIAAWLTFGCLTIESNWSWRVPSLVQAPIALVQLVLLFGVPQSPRWLVSQGRTDEALDILVRYHANGLRTDEMVLRELHEIQIAVEEAREYKSNSMLNFFKTPGNRKRLAILIFVALFIQWCGNGIISYYLSPILESSGIETANQQQGINGGLQMWSWFWALFAAFTCNRFKRRTLWLTSYAGMLVSYVIFTALNATFAKSGNKAIGAASIPFLFFFNASYSLAATALCYLYCLEILPQGLRAQGMVIMLVVDYGAIFFNSYVNPVALEAMQWRYFLVYIAILAACLAFIWWYFPETSGLSVEEAAMVCDGPEAREKLENQAVDRAAIGAAKGEVAMLEDPDKADVVVEAVHELR